MEVIYPNPGRFFLSEIRRLVIISLIAWLVVFFRWRSASYPDPSLWLGRGLVIYGAFILCWFPIRWILLVPTAIEINASDIAFYFYFQKVIRFSIVDIDRCGSMLGIFNIKLKNGRIIKILPSPYPGQQWTYILHKLNSTSLK